MNVTREGINMLLTSFRFSIIVKVSRQLWSGHVLHSGTTEREQLRGLDRDARLFLFNPAIHRIEYNLKMFY